VTDWMRAHPYTLLSGGLLVALIAVLALTGQPLTTWLLVVAAITLTAWRGITRGRRNGGD
jgi:Flp pilus assembly protein TadB